MAIENMAMTWEEFEKTFKPIKNPFYGKNFGSSEYMFETYGDEIDYVNKIAQEKGARYIWTDIDGDGWNTIDTGIHFVNRMGYYITEVPWSDEDNVQVILSDPDVDEWMDLTTGEKHTYNEWQEITRNKEEDED